MSVVTALVARHNLLYGLFPLLSVSPATGHALRGCKTGSGGDAATREQRYQRTGPRDALMSHTFIAIACVCQGTERGDAGRGGMTNCGQLKPPGLNTIVVAERGHYWKWLCHRGRLC